MKLMSLQQITSEENVQKEYSKLNLLQGRSFKIFHPLPNLPKEPGVLGDLLITNLQDCYSTLRNTHSYCYSNLFELSYYKYIYADMLGLTTMPGCYTVIFTLQDSLDLVLHTLCGCNMSNIRRIPRYFEISRVLLNVDSSNIEKLGSFHQLVGYDEKLDDYLLKLCEDPDNLPTRFLEQIIRVCNNLTSYHACVFSRNYPRKLVTLCRSFCTYIMRCTEPVNEVLIIDKKYKLYIKSFEPYGYLDRIEETFI